MKFYEGRTINKIQMPITNICNRRCPDCCAREQLMWYNSSIKEREVAIEELRRVGQLIGPISQMEITGGEPTMHSKFDEISNNLTELFQCNDFMLVTNGWLFGVEPRKLSLLMNYKRVWLSHYTEEFAAKNGGKSNTAECEAIERFVSDTPHTELIPFTPAHHIPYAAPPYSGIPCIHYRSGMITCYQGNLYGCCVAWSLPLKAASIPLTEDWREHLTELDTPCENCFITGPRQ